MKFYCRYLHQLLFGLALVCITGIQAQPHHLKLQASADLEYTNLKYTQAITLYQKMVHKNPANAYAISRIADCYWRMRDFNSALLWYEKIQLTGMDSVNMAGYIHVLMANGKYTEAKKRCKEYIDLHAGEKKIGGLLQHLQHLDLFFHDSANWRTDFVNINSDDEDFCPVFYNKGLVFVSNRTKNDLTKKRASHSISIPSFCKIYYVADTANIKILPGFAAKYSPENREGLSWEDVSQAGLPSNKNLAISLLNLGVKTHLNIGPVTFSSDGKTAYYNWNGKMQKDLGVSRLELFSASFINGSFTGESNFKYNGTDYSVEHPSLSPDGQFLYFASNKKGGAGAFDIYSCKKNDSSWNTPKNLGKLVNTDGNEMFPFADAQGNLYFASDGWPGLGALDIFYVKMKEGMPVGPPLNLGYPVNSSYDDFGIAVTRDSASGYFSSNRRDGNDDIYRFDYLKNQKENVKVAVLDTVSRLRMDGVVVNRKDEKETINNWSVYVNGSSSDAVSRLLINGVLVNRIEENIAPDNQLVYVIGTVMDSISKLRVDGVTIDIKEVEGTDNFHFVTNNSGNFGAYWKNDCLLDIVLTKSGYHEFHMRVRTEQIRNHFILVFLKPGVDVKPTEDVVVRKAPVKMVNPPTYIDGNPALFEDELGHLTDSLHTVVLKRYSVYYNLGSSTIGPDDKTVIDSIVNFAKNHPQSTILVAGFTDCRGDSIVNIQLAKKRAGTVRRLLQKLGLHPSRINTEYFGKKRLVVPCKEGYTYDKDKQRVNRRSEIVLLKKGSSIAQKQDKETDRINIAIVAEKNKRAENMDAGKSISPIKGGHNKVITEEKVVNNSRTTLPPLAASKESSDKYNTSAKKVIVTEIKDRQNKVITEEKKENNSDNVLPQLVTPKDSSDRYNTTEKKVMAADSFYMQRKEADLVEEMSKRISKTPILLHTNSDSVHIELYDNGVFDYDTISIIYNGKLLIFKQLLKVDKAISFYVKVDNDERKNEMIFFADNLGLIPPNSALMVITDGDSKRTEVSVTNDLGHNAVIYFIKPKKKADS